MLRSPLLQALCDRHAIPVLSPAEFSGFIQQQACVAVLCTENPTQFPESNDVAVILPQLARHFSTLLVPALADEALEKQLQAQYRFYKWPTLLFLRRGELLGSVTGMQSWYDFVIQVENILALPSQSAPGIVRFIEPVRQ